MVLTNGLPNSQGWSTLGMSIGTLTEARYPTGVTCGDGPLYTPRPNTVTAHMGLPVPPPGVNGNVSAFATMSARFAFCRSAFAARSQRNSVRVSARATILARSDSSSCFALASSREVLHRSQIWRGSVPTTEVKMQSAQCRMPQS